jgi:hypothetical protein
VSGETHVDLGVLAALSVRLKSDSADLDAVGVGAPGAPDAGDFTEVLSAVVAHMADSAGNVVTGMLAAAEHVDQARADYVAQDTAAAADLRGGF